ncbi:unnamed protein product [Polarella glacialis]|uniref:Uncharacterized protein n=1 Tax=Polarella glacialis TaxID=89957 RepID=A0A813E933_POLGL|nr:unnamed protein product [Polarella glacialis]
MPYLTCRFAWTPWVFLKRFPVASLVVVVVVISFLFGKKADFYELELVYESDVNLDQGFHCPDGMLFLSFAFKAHQERSVFISGGSDTPASGSVAVAAVRRTLFVGSAAVITLPEVA